MKGVWVTKEGCELKDFPVPAPGPNEVLIKNVAVASNPKDWKIPIWVEAYGNIEGNDVAGYVEEVGAGVTEFKKGDKVAAFTKIMREYQKSPKYGAYAEYSVSPSWTTFHLGQKTTFEEAATIPLAYMTAAVGLYRSLRLPETTLPGLPISILIWGASSTVGSYAVQLAKRSGFHVLGVAGSGIDHAKAVGADDVIDYRGKSSDELVGEISKAARGKIRHAFDAISTSATVETIVKALQPQGGRVTYTLYFSHDFLQSMPPNIAMDRTSVRSVHVAKGEEAPVHDPAERGTPGDPRFAEKWFKKVGEWLGDGSFKPQTVQLMPNGLLSVEEGLRMLKADEVRGTKLVYRISDTRGVIS